jgi:hypothetical protein
MEMIVHSTNIIDVEYDRRQQLLTVLFQNAGTYLVRECPEEKFQGLTKSDHPGSYYHREIAGPFKDKITKIETRCCRCGELVVKGQQYAFVNVNVIYGDGKSVPSRRACHRGCLPPGAANGN